MLTKSHWRNCQKEVTLISDLTDDTDPIEDTAIEEDITFITSQEMINNDYKADDDDYNSTNEW